MSKIREALWQEYEKATKELESCNVGSDEYKVVSERQDRIWNDLIKLEQVDTEDKNEFIRNLISVGTFGITTVVTIWSVNKTFKFDKVATVTSTLGKGILNGAIPKMFRR